MYLRRAAVSGHKSLKRCLEMASCNHDDRRLIHKEANVGVEAAWARYAKGGRRPFSRATVANALRRARAYRYGTVQTYSTVRYGTVQVRYSRPYENPI